MRRIEMTKAKEILGQHQALGLSQRTIAEATGCSVGAVSNILHKAETACIKFPIQISDKELVSPLYPTIKETDAKQRTEPDLLYMHREMQRKGVKLTLLWEEYKAKYPDGLMFTQFCDRYRTFRK